MSWQDVIITLSLLVFVLGMIPALRGNDKPAFATCVTFTIILVAYGIAYASLELWLSVVLDAVLTIEWATLAAQQWRRRVNLAEIL